MSKLFLRTLRDDPADAEVPSHRLLIRAGYIRRAAPGGFTWLPLGWIVFRNVERIVREEMNAAGFQEVHFPALLPKEPYEATGRYADYGDNLFRLQDRHGNDFLLAPTHEEMFTLIVKDLLSSYKDLPLSIYQIQTKYRDEARPSRRPAARPRVRDEGLVQLRHRRRGVHGFVRGASRRVHQDLRAARAARRDRVGDVGSHGRFGFRGVPGAGRRRRGHLRSVHRLRLRSERRGGPGHGSRHAPVRRLAARDGGRHARHTHDPDTRRPPQRPSGVRSPGRAGLDRRRHDEERHRQVAPPRRFHRADGDRRARRSRGRSQATRRTGRAGRGRAVRRSRLRQERGAREGLHRAGRARHRQLVGHPVPRRPPHRRRHPLGHRRQRSPAST